MQLTVNIEDKDLNEVITKGIKGLSEETLTELAKEALMNHLMSEKGLEAMIYEPTRNYYDRRDLNRNIQSMLTNSFTKEEVEEYRQKLFQVMEKDCDRLISDTLTKVFINMMVTEDFKQELWYNIHSLIQKE